MGTKIRLNLTTLLLLIQISLRPKFLRNVIKVVKEVIQPLGSIPLRLSRRIKIKSRTGAMLNATPTNRRVIMPISIPKSYKINGGLSNLYVNN